MARSKLKKRSKRSLATDFTSIVRKEVLLRDKGFCVYCGNMHNIQIHHYIERSLNGLGIKENLVCLCVECHMRLHSNDKGNVIKKTVKKYLDKLYPNFDDKDRKYDKWRKE